MAILCDKNSKVMVQGITGGAGKFHTDRMLAYGTNIVGGTSPGKGGLIVSDKPVFDTVAECVEETGADVSVIFLPAQFVKEAAIEAIRARNKICSSNSRTYSYSRYAPCQRRSCPSRYYCYWW